jgi:hypothetical protein
VKPSYHCLLGIDGELRTDHGAELAVDAGCFLARDNLGQVIALAVDVAGDLEDLLRAEMNTQFTALATLGDEEHLAARNRHPLEVERSA